MVTIVDDAHAFVDVLADEVGAGRHASNALVITMYCCVVVVKKVVADIVGMLVIGLIGLAFDFVFTKAQDRIFW